MRLHARSARRPDRVRWAAWTIVGICTLGVLAKWMLNSSSAQEKGAHVRAPLPTAEDVAGLPPDGGPEFNRLVHETSPYLLQHARNPVDWYPWGDEAFARAKRENKPVFLSIGYSTCHWCHVMEVESFENDEVAKLMNDNFVSIKVDREERPDVDAIYMNATYLVTGRGGWPNSLWLTPDRKPFYAGTYFPPEDRFGQPGFKRILTSLAKAWQDRREDVDKQANQIAEAMKGMASKRAGQGKGELSRELVKAALGELRQSFDATLGGFGGAPKFPPHGALRLVLHEALQGKNAAAVDMATFTLDQMARGGIHDHVGGGFHRYSTDAKWFLPHFEKMLYDNAMLGRAYVDAFLVTKDERYRAVAVDLFEWVLREMTDAQGGFYSALDADSEGEEGKFYVWERKEVLAILGPEEGALFCEVYGFEKGGNFGEEATGEKPGTNIPHLVKPLAEVAKEKGVPLAELAARLQRGRQKLLPVRDKRVHPHLDDKVLASWNGLMIGSLAYGGRHLDEDRYLAAAEKAAHFALDNMRKGGRLQRTYRAGQAKLNAYLDDYAFLADGLIELHEATGEKQWLKEAAALADVMIEHHSDDAGGGFFFTSDDHEDLLVRSKDPTDRALPSGNGVAARVLVQLGHHTGKKRYLDAGRQALEAFHALMERAPRATQSLILATAAYVDAPGSEGVAGVGSAAPQPDARARKTPVTIEAFASHVKAAPGQEVRIAVRLVVDEGWHVNSNKPLQDYLIPTSLALAEGSVGELGDVVYPEGKELELVFSPKPLSVYEGGTWISGTVTIPADAAAVATALRLNVRFQACNDRSCLAPETVTLAVALAVDPASRGGELRHQKVFDALKR